MPYKPIGQTEHGKFFNPSKTLEGMCKSKEVPLRDMQVRAGEMTQHKPRDLNLDPQNSYKCWVLMPAYLWFQPQKADRDHHSKVVIQLNSGFDLKNLTSRRIGWTARIYTERRKRKQAMYMTAAIVRILHPCVFVALGV